MWISQVKISFLRLCIGLLPNCMFFDAVPNIELCNYITSLVFFASVTNQRMGPVVFYPAVKVTNAHL